MGVTTHFSNKTRQFLLSVTVLLGILSKSVFGLDDITVVKPPDENDHKLDYTYEVMELALKVTEPNFGGYTLQHSAVEMVRKRQFEELATGNLLTVIISPPIPGVQKMAHRVQFPVNLGLGSYRMFFIMKESQAILNKVTTLEELKKIPTGQGAHWTFTTVLQANNFDVVTGTNYIQLFNMLEFGRFVTFSRGINEIYQEYNTLKSKYPNLAIDNKIITFSYLPSYFYVSLKHPKIAKRLYEGLLMIHESGDLIKIFNKYHSENIERAKIPNRKLFVFDNPNVSPSMFSHDKPYLIDLGLDIESNR